MARFVLLIVLLFAAGMANESSNKVVETRKVAQEQNEKLNKFSNATNDRFEQIAKKVDQRHNQTLEDVKRQNQKLDELSEIAERLVQLFQGKFPAPPSPCILARSANLKMLSNGKKYFFSTNKKTWTSANVTCARLGLHLATIANLTDAQVVIEEGKKMHGRNVWWVSAKNQGRGSEIEFRWQDGTKLESDSPLWADGATKTDDCVYIYNYNKGKLYSHPCSGTTNILCELPKQCYN
ncbi:uncharacterized protein LOC132194006 isoform X2 [Neocloeon triangulifer]|uniref:uncharacterized protein LOC132194006 isoform X2 n=1 Tax=Neocloeon triangulifer TaxID=2078957 RepID=UPI00286F1DA5|nr:uncharacterized protein LOC132194006 isoform X2 [Neocloeon triangulifer]